MNEHKLLEKTVSYCADQGVDYADARFVSWEQEFITQDNGVIQNIVHHADSGIGVRVLASGCWGFAATLLKDEKSLIRACTEAVLMAKVSAPLSLTNIDWKKQKSHQGSYESRCDSDPFSVPLTEKIDLLSEVHAKLKKNKTIKLTDAILRFAKVHKNFYNSEGTKVQNSWIESGAEYAAKAQNETDTQIRHFYLDVKKRGFEWIKEQKLIENAERVAAEAEILLKAPSCPTKKTTLILDSNQMVLQVHESVGHPLELDRIFGSEASYAGRSFVNTEMREKFQYAAPIVNITLDSTIQDGLGTFGFDDDGVPAQRVPLIKHGILKNFLTSREYAEKIGLESNACNVASSWNRLPVIRMTGVHLEPGNMSFEKILETTEDGIYMATNKSWSIDDVRLNFQFGCEWAQEIKNGKLGKVYKNPNYQGMTPEFWKSCTAIADKNSWRVWGVPNCGKGEPGQVGRVCHGTSPSRFQNVQVFGT